MNKIKYIAFVTLIALFLTGCNTVVPISVSVDDTSLESINSSSDIDRSSITDETSPIDENDESSNNTGNTEVDDGAVFTLTFGGDTCLDGYYGSFADTLLGWAGVDYSFTEIKPIFGASDYTIINLETSVSDRGESEKRAGFGFRTPPELLQSFVNAGVDMMCLANNHLRDFGVQGVEDTLYNLTEYGLDYVGAGYSIDEARSCKIKEINGIKVGFLAYNTIVSNPDWLAGEDKAGMAAWTTEMSQLYLDDIKRADSECDVLIVSVHWGEEETYVLNETQKTLGRLFVDSGADLVIGHHSHVVQAVEYYKGVPIFHSVGNLLFYKLEDDLDGLSAVFEVEMNKNGVVSAKLYPVFIGGYKVNLLSEDSKRYNHILSALGMCSLEYGVGVDEKGNLIFDFDGDEPILEPVELVTIDLVGIRSE